MYIQGSIAASATDTPLSRTTIRVLTVDDHAVVRAGVAVLANHPGVDVVGEATDGDEGLAHFLELPPDVVLVDLRMPKLMEWRRNARS